MKSIKMPNHVDDPHMFLLWSVDEAIPIMIALVIGIMIEKTPIAVLIGWGVSYLYKRFKNSKPDGYLLHFFYWMGFLPEKGKALVNPFKREWFA